MQRINGNSASKPKYPGKRVTTNGNQLVSSTEALMAEAGVFYPITPSTEMGELYQLAYAKGQLTAFGEALTAIEAEGEHAAQGGAIAMSVTGRRVVNFTSGQGVVYGVEQYYHAPGKLSTMVVEVGARALTKHALNVHCGHDDIYAALDTGWTILFAKHAQQVVDQAIILRKVNELTLNPGINVQDGFLTTHLERSFLKPEPGLIREFLGAKDDMIECPTEAQRLLFGPARRRVPAMVDLKNPILLGPVQNQEHYMNGVAARRNNFSEFVLPALEQAYAEFGGLTGRYYGLVSQYNCEDADTVFVALGSAAENIEAACDYLKATRNVDVGVVHINVLRPFPENAVIQALRGRKRVIILERTDEPLSCDNPLTRDVKVALSKAASNHFDNTYETLESLDPAREMPQIVSGVYGLGSRDFRPEGIIGAYDFAQSRLAREDGRRFGEGVNFCFVGIDHPYAVVSEETPSCLPDGAIAIRFHSVGGWGMITTGKNLGEILGQFSNYVAERDQLFDDNSEPQEVLHISANPKYGSEKKGAPTNYFLVAAPQRVRVNCDLRHVNVVLCCDPKVFLHTNPLSGLQEGGAFVWESADSPERAWQRIPQRFRREIIEKKIRIYILNGFAIAKEATDRQDLQTRMQGNSFLGAFFRVSPLLNVYKIKDDDFLEMVRNQYVKKFGRFGEAVVESNMTVMRQGFRTVQEVPYGPVEAPDISGFVGDIISPCSLEGGDGKLLTIAEEGGNGGRGNGKNGTNGASGDGDKAPMFKMSTFDQEFRSGLGYNQPSSPLASVGVMAAATGATASKYVARREIPLFIEENCTQCMDCITVCPDSALPNTAQDISAVLSTAISNYITDSQAKSTLLTLMPKIEESCRHQMLEKAPAKDDRTRFKDIVIDVVTNLQHDSVTPQAVTELSRILDVLPVAYKASKAIFLNKEKKEPGAGGLFSIFVNDLCKGCAACVEACGDHQALKMVPESEELNARYHSAAGFLALLRDTPQKYLGIFDAQTPQDSKAAALRYHLMMQSKYTALVAGDGACAGCGEKSVLRTVATLTETLMKPIFNAKAQRLEQKANLLSENGKMLLAEFKKRDKASYETFRKSVLHLLMGYGGENSDDTSKNIASRFQGGDGEIVDAIVAVMRQDAFNHTKLQLIEGFQADGMAVMAMAAHTGCNTVYGSTPPNNPHPYPWMNSLFQDGATIGWIIGESFIKDHARYSVLPERLADYLMVNSGEEAFGEEEYFQFTHFSDLYMTDDEVMELPRVWVVGGDGGMGDIGFQNVSKAVLQNRPNVKMLMMDTQVYSNTGGQNSDSSPMTGGFDMNQAGAASEGKLTEKKSVAECFLAGHGSPYVAQVSMANSANLYKSILDGLCYRGIAFFQVFTTCQPEHGVPDHAAQLQAQRIRDSRGMPEFVFDPQLGETYQEALSIKGNPSEKKDWYTKKAPVTKTPYDYTVAHWTFTEARFRFHHMIVQPEKVQGLIRLEDKLKMITMDDVVKRRYVDRTHRSFIPVNGVYTIDYDDAGGPVYHILSRQMVIFCVERRKAWRILQSKAGIINEDYLAQKELLSRIDAGELSIDAATNGDEAKVTLADA